MLNAAVVERKLAKLEQYLRELAAVRPPTFQEYEQSLLHRRAVERLIQLLVDVANDINAYVLVALGQPPPDDYHEGFVRMGEIGVLPADLAERLAPSAGARNILVHEYERIDDRIVFDSVDEALRDFQAYGRAVLDYLKRAGSTHPPSGRPGDAGGPAVTA